MMFGTRESFAYFKCTACGCLQLAQFPSEMSAHYPPHYFSFSGKRCRSGGVLRAFLDRKRIAHEYGKRNLVGWLANKIAKRSSFLDWIQGIPIGRANILDVGCGCGRLLLRMRAAGVGTCLGLDPYLPRDIHYSCGVRIYRSDLSEFVLAHRASFDLIMFHHSLEHFEDPLKMLRSAARVLAQDGSVLIRVPLVDSEAWDRYGGHWYQIDAPRHLYLHTRERLAILARRAGLAISRIVWDSTPSQFAVRELFRRDIASNEARPKDVLHKAELRQFRQLTELVNAQERGDMAAFFVKRVG